MYERRSRKVLDALLKDGCDVSSENIVAAFEDLNFE